MSRHYWRTVYPYLLGDDDRYGKKLSHEQLMKLQTVETTSNALFLMTFLEEMRVFGSFEQLNDTIDKFLRASGTVALFGLIVQRLCTTFGRKVVLGVFGLIFCSREGLQVRL